MMYVSRLHGLYGYVVPFLQYFSDDKKIQQEPCIAFLLENVFFLLFTKTSRIIIMHLKIIVVIDNGKR